MRTKRTGAPPTIAELPEAIPYPFVGEALALDLVNTELVVRGQPHDLLDRPGGYAAWWRAVLARDPEAGGEVRLPPVVETPALLAAAKRLRAALRRLVGAVAAGTPLDPTDLDLLNRILAAGDEAIEPDAAGRPRAVRRPRGGGPDAALLPVALSARELLLGRDPARLHRCGNDRCILFFYDTTKSATRRWCSVTCMDRARSAKRYRERQQAAAGSAA